MPEASYKNGLEFRGPIVFYVGMCLIQQPRSFAMFGTVFALHYGLQNNIVIKSNTRKCLRFGVPKSTMLLCSQYNYRDPLQCFYSYGIPLRSIIHLFSNLFSCFTHRLFIIEVMNCIVVIVFFS